MKPIRNQIYTFEEITKLELLDSPSLCVYYEKMWIPIQNSHVLDSDLLQVEGIKNTEWIYEKTTYEWIPIFQALDSKEVLELCTLQRVLGYFNGDKEDIYLCWKGFFRDFLAEQEELKERYGD